jgi:sulfur-oxidizing protein SoxZ
MKKLILALASMAFMATSTMAEAPATTTAPTKVKMKIKAKEKDGVVKAKVAITHDMLTYDQAKKKGKEANFITHITGTVGDKVVYDASTSQFLSKNPLIKFVFSGKKGDELKITYTQLKGEKFFATKKIK